jgi:hypothetical protein
MKSIFQFPHIAWPFVLLRVSIASWKFLNSGTKLFVQAFASMKSTSSGRSSILLEGQEFRSAPHLSGSTNLHGRFFPEPLIQGFYGLLRLGGHRLFYFGTTYSLDFTFLDSSKILVWVGSPISPISSRNKVPPWQISNCPALASVAPVKAPFSCPKIRFR